MLTEGAQSEFEEILDGERDKDKQRTKRCHQRNYRDLDKIEATFEELSVAVGGGISLPAPAPVVHSEGSTRSARHGASLSGGSLQPSDSASATIRHSHKGR